MKKLPVYLVLFAFTLSLLAREPKVLLHVNNLLDRLLSVLTGSYPCQSGTVCFRSYPSRNVNERAPSTVTSDMRRKCTESAAAT